MCKSRDYPCERGWAFCLVDLSAGSPLTHSDQTYVHTRITFRATRREYRNCGGEKKANPSVRRECGTRITLSRLQPWHGCILYIQQISSSHFDSFCSIYLRRSNECDALCPMHAYEPSFLASFSKYAPITLKILTMVSAGNSPEES